MFLRLIPVAECSSSSLLIFNFWVVFCYTDKPYLYIHYSVNGHVRPLYGFLLFEIYSLIHGLFRSYMFYFLSLQWFSYVSHVEFKCVPLFDQRTNCMISFLLKLSSFGLWPRIWSYNLFCELLGKKMCVLLLLSGLF